MVFLQRQLTKNYFEKVLIIIECFFIPVLVLAQAPETDTKMITDNLEIQTQNIQSQEEIDKLNVLKEIEQGITEIKQRIFTIRKEIQEQIESVSLSTEVKSNMLKKLAEMERTEKKIITEEATSTEATSTEATSTEAFTTSTNATTSTATTTSTTTPVSEWHYSGGGGGPAPAPDVTAPSTITNLSASNSTITSIDINWSSPGDNANLGTATSYDIRYSTAPINDLNWSSATQVSDEPNPLLAGSAQSITISNLSPNTTYYFAIKTSDEVPNESGLSNITSKTTKTVEECAVPIVSGSRMYFTRSSGSNPQIMRVDIDEVAVNIGEEQTISAQIRDTSNNPITLVTGSVQLDNSNADFPLALISGEEANGTWAGSWSPSDTLCNNYSITITATSISGLSHIVISLR